MKLFRYEKVVYDKVVDGVPIQVIDRGDQRELRFGNHITQSARSLLAPDVMLLDYARAMLAALLFVPKPATVLHFGLGGGTLPDALHRHLPEVQQRVVELNPGVVEVAYRYFDLPVSERLEVVVQDGLDYLESDPSRYALIFVDAFHADGPAPQMNTDAVFRMLRDRLERGGWLAVNTWGSQRERLAQVRECLRATFAQLHFMSVRTDSNVIFYASSESRQVSLAQMKRRAQWLSQQFPLDFVGLLQRVHTAYAPPGRAPMAGRLGT